MRENDNGIGRKGSAWLGGGKKASDFRRKIQILAWKAVLVSGLAAFMIGAAGCPPQINSLDATQGEPGTVITIRGSNFGGTPGANRVFLGDKKQMHIVTEAPDKITAMVPYDSGTYVLTVVTAKGASAARSFTVLPQELPSAAATAGVQAAGITTCPLCLDWSDWFESCVWCMWVTSGTFPAIRSPYAIEVYEPLDYLWRTALPESGLSDEVFAKINDLYVESGLPTDCYYDSLFWAAYTDMSEFDRIAGTFEAFLDNAASVVAQESPNPELEAAFSNAAAAIARARLFLPPSVDMSPPEVWIDDVPDLLEAGNPYSVTAYAFDDLMADQANIGVSHLTVTVRYIRAGNVTVLAEEVIDIDVLDPEAETIAQGYAHPLSVQFTVPAGATPADLIEFEVAASDPMGRYVDTSFQRRPNTTYVPPRVSIAYMTPTEFDDLDALANADVYLAWAGEDLARLEFEFFGDGVKDGSTFEISASEPGTMSRKVSELLALRAVSVSDVFQEDKTYHAGMRVWLVDVLGNRSASKVVPFFVVGPGNETVFILTVGDSGLDGSRDDIFSFIVDGWSNVYRTQSGAELSRPVRVGDIRPDETLTLRVKCISSADSSEMGSAFAEVSDGATFNDGSTRMTFDAPWLGAERVFEIIPPPVTGPPAPGS